MRTTVLDCLLLAWRLIRLHEQRRHLRIGQILLNHLRDPRLYYAENELLNKTLKRP